MKTNISWGCVVLPFNDQELQGRQAWMINGIQEHYWSIIFPPELMCHNWNECCSESNKCCVFWSPTLYDRWDFYISAQSCHQSQRHTHILANPHIVYPNACVHMHAQLPLILLNTLSMKTPVCHQYWSDFIHLSNCWLYHNIASTKSNKNRDDHTYCKQANSLAFKPIYLEVKNKNKHNWNVG